MSRFIYNANGLALGGRMTAPANREIEPQSPCVLPSVGGRGKATGRAVEITEGGVMILKIAGSETTVDGTTDGTTVTTTVRSVVEGLNVLGVLKADAVIAQLTIRYDLATNRIAVSAAGSGFDNLTLAGSPLAIGCDELLCAEAGDFEKFKKAHTDKPDVRGKICYSLGKNEKLKFAPPEFGYIDQPDFGRIYFYDWSASLYSQRFAMLRLQLGSPAKGEVVIAGAENNGIPYP